MMTNGKDIDSSRHPLAAAFTSLGGRLRAMARSMLRDPDRADDAVQEAFARLWGHRESITQEPQAGAMSVTTVRNVCLDMLRRDATHPTTAINEEVTRQADETADDRAELLKEVNAAIDEALSERDREMLLRRDRDGWGFDELAEAYGLSEGGARLAVSRARKAVRELYLKKQKS